MIWYCDSSALVKRYVRETGSSWFRREQSHHSIVTSSLALPEVASALARRWRDGTLSMFEFHRNRARFARHLRARQYVLLPPTLSLLEQASLLVYRLPLAAYDSVHLATALDYLRSGGTDANQYCFVTADAQLQRAAEAEGLNSVNPNDHS